MSVLSALLNQNRNRKLFAGAVLIVVLVAIAGAVIIHKSSDTSAKSENAVTTKSAGTKTDATIKSGAGSEAQQLSPAAGGSAKNDKQSSASVQAVPNVPAGGMAIGLAGGAVKAGATFTVRLYENSGAVAVNAVQAKLNYDPAQLEYVSAEQTDAFSVAAATDTSTVGIVRLARSTGSGSTPTGQQPVADITFKVQAATTGNTNLQLDKAESFIVKADDASNILQTVSGATFTINNN